MPLENGSNGKRHSPQRKGPKLPNGAPEVLEKSDVAKDNQNGKVATIVHELMASEWHPYGSAPFRRVAGFYVMMRWFSKEKSWVPLFVSGSDNLQVQIQHQFIGKERSPIGVYLSSFAKDARRVIWVKWVEVPRYPDQSLKLDDVIESVARNYNDGFTLAFNSDEEVAKPLPKDFSIVPDWKPAQSKSNKKRKNKTLTQL